MAVEQTAQEMETKEINVKVIGHELISKKLLDVVTHILVQNDVHEYDDCIRVIEFAENEPYGKFGGFDIDNRRIIINMQSHFDYACDALDDENLAKLGLRSHIWFGLMTTAIHEILHAVAYAIDADTVLNTDRRTLEDNLNEETGVHLKNLIRDYEVEPPLFEDDPFYGTRYLEFYTKKIKDNAEQWAIHQKSVHDNKCIWTDEDVVCDSFREWYRVGYKHHEDNEWNKEVAPLMTADIVDATPEFIGDVIQQPVAETAVEGIAAVTEVVVANTPAPVETTVAPVATPEPLDIDPESLMALYNAEEPIDLPNSVDDYGTAGMMMATPAPAPQPVVAQPTVAPQTPVAAAPALPKAEVGRCRECQAELQPGVKFCGFCGIGVEKTPMPKLMDTTPVATNTPAHTPNPQYQQAPMATNLPNYNLSAEQIRECVGQIFMRCYDHIFAKCGFQPGQNPQFAPELRNAVAEPLSVIGIPCVEQILVAMDCTDQMGRYAKHAPAVNGMIRGKVTKTNALPSYTLYLNFNGYEVKRLIVPQNMWKVSRQGGYSGPAQRAQQGAAITWLIDGDDSTPGKKWKAKIENGNLEWLI